MVIDNFKLSDVPMFLHDPEKFEEDFGSRSDNHLLLPFSLSIDDGLEAVSEDVGSCHLCDFVVKII